MLTKNLYREDEVVAALKWCVLRGRFSEAAFWTTECMESNMMPQCLEALLWAWCFGCGPSALGWIQRFARLAQNGEPINHEEVLNMTASLVKHCRRAPDSSVIALLGLGLMELRKGKEILGAHTLPALLFPPTPEQTAVLRAALQGKAAYAWSLARPQWCPDLWAGLTAVGLSRSKPAEVEQFKCALNTLELATTGWLKHLVPSTTAWVWPLRAVAVAAVSGVHTKFVEELDIPVPEILGEYESWRFLPMRFRRIFQIPQSCLGWMTERGLQRVDETNDPELTHHLEASLQTSKFWGPLVPELVASDESRELFYDKFFPTDIPDEWSQADREKSHGVGSIPAHDPVDMRTLFQVYLNRWFGTIPSLAVWQGTPTALREFVQRWPAGWELGGSLETSLIDAYREELAVTWRAQLDTMDFTAMRRELEAIA